MGRRGPKRGSARANKITPKVVKPLNPIKIYRVVTPNATTFIDANYVEFYNDNEITFSIEYDNDQRSIQAGFKSWTEFVATDSR